ncbi:MAG: sensor histidine kinase [Vicinamibacterales bacterium]
MTGHRPDVAHAPHVALVGLAPALAAQVARVLAPTGARVAAFAGEAEALAWEEDGRRADLLVCGHTGRSVAASSVAASSVAGHGAAHTIDALDTMQRVRALAPTMPVAVFAAAGSEDVAVAAIKAGAASYVPAPADDSELWEMLREGLQAAASGLGPRLSRLLDNLDIGMFRFDPDDRLVEANDALRRILHQPSLDALYARTDVCRFLADLARDGGGTPRTVRTRLLADHGTDVVVETGARAVVDGQGVAQGWEGYVIDVTEREDARARATTRATLIEQVRHAVIATDEHLTVVVWNHGAEMLCGWPAGETLGQPLMVVAEKLGMTDQVHTIIAVLQDGGRWEGEVQYRRQDGQAGESYLRAAALSIDGAFAGFVGSAVDIAERKQLEAQLTEAVAARERLLTEALRRVRSNLQLVSSLINVQLARQGDESLRLIARDTQNRIRAIALMNEWLLPTPGQGLVNMQGYLVQIAEYLGAAFSRESRVHISCTVEPIAMGAEQATRVGLAVNELVVNALKHAFPGVSEGTIVVRLAAQPGGETAELVVRDSGVGLPEAYDPLTSTTLGLRLVLDLAQRLDASLTVERTGGTTFRFVLPLHEQA